MWKVTSIMNIVSFYGHYWGVSIDTEVLFVDVEDIGFCRSLIWLLSCFCVIITHVTILMSNIGITYVYASCCIVS